MTNQDKQEMVVTPWEVSGDIDYGKLIEQFGVQPMTQGIADRIAKHAGYMHMQLRRGVYISHRDTDWWLDEYEKGNRVGLYTGRGPSGHVHLGHLLPWFFCKYLQDAFDADLYFQMTDDEKYLFNDHLELEQTIGYTYDNALDVIACGLDPGKTHIFSDTEHIQHLYKIGLRVAKRVTYSTAKAVFGFQDSDNIGMIWYPALQAMTCFLQSDREGANIPCLIPAAIDQDPYWRMTRDIAEKLGYYKPAQIHAKFLPGLAEGGKMSASQPETAIFTTDPPKVAAKKVMSAFTGGRDTVEEQKRLGGRPEVCNVYAYYYFLFEDDDEALRGRELACKSGSILCGECKKQLAERVKAFLVDFQAKREKAKDVLDDFLIKPVE
ncbi:MAG TPA: tryptophan--tRNA ligase [Candidatus Krumholzibacteriaceae bacterium]|nr:tryptophan--tRNA ligase [Candidatus Krumholzibacteriaceae bacterium]